MAPASPDRPTSHRREVIALAGQGTSLLAQLSALVILLAWLAGHGSLVAWLYALGVAMIGAAVQALAETEYIRESDQ